MRDDAFCSDCLYLFMPIWGHIISECNIWFAGFHLLRPERIRGNYCQVLIYRSDMLVIFWRRLATPWVCPIYWCNNEVEKFIVTGIYSVIYALLYANFSTECLMRLCGSNLSIKAIWMIAVCYKRAHLIGYRNDVEVKPIAAEVGTVFSLFCSAPKQKKWTLFHLLSEKIR